MSGHATLRNSWVGHPGQGTHLEVAARVALAVQVLAAALAAALAAVVGVDSEAAADWGSEEKAVQG